MENGVVRVAGQHCARYIGRDACIAARDPHCGWDDHTDKCTPVPDEGPDASYWEQEPFTCPTFHHPGNESLGASAFLIYILSVFTFFTVHYILLKTEYLTIKLY